MWSGRVIGMSKGTIDDFEEHLKRCSVFYWIGGPPEMSNYLFHHLGKQMLLLKQYIESGKVLFVGVGRGASIVGASSAAHEEVTMGLLPRVIKSSDDTEQKQGEAMVLHPSVMFLVGESAKVKIDCSVGGRVGCAHADSGVAGPDGTTASCG